jgi:hypothetical protein
VAGIVHTYLRSEKESSCDSNGGSLAGRVLCTDDREIRRESELPTERCLPWFALHVPTRHEVGVSTHLKRMGYEDFLPLYKTHAGRIARKKQTHRFFRAISSADLIPKTGCQS